MNQSPLELDDKTKEGLIEALESGILPARLVATSVSAHEALSQGRSLNKDEVEATLEVLQYLRSQTAILAVAIGYSELIYKLSASSMSVRGISD